jgi:predicted nucleic acid-binding protein
MARTRREAQADCLILDSGAVIALSRQEERARAYLQRALELDADVIVPVVVLAETLRGGPRDAQVNRVLKAIGEVEPTSAMTGRVAGSLLGATGMDDTIDAIVVAEAVTRGGGRILTSDPVDLSALAEGQASVRIDSLAPPSRRRRRTRR